MFAKAYFVLCVCNIVGESVFLEVEEKLCNMELKQLLENIRIAFSLISDWEKNGGINELERDLLLDKLKEAYECVKFGKQEEAVVVESEAENAENLSSGYAAASVLNMERYKHIDILIPCADDDNDTENESVSAGAAETETAKCEPSTETIIVENSNEAPEPVVNTQAEQAQQPEQLAVETVAKTETEECDDAPVVVAENTHSMTDLQSSSALDENSTLQDVIEDDSANEEPELVLEHSFRRRKIDRAAIRLLYGDGDSAAMKQAVESKTEEIGANGTFDKEQSDTPKKEALAESQSKLHSEKETDIANTIAEDAANGDHEEKTSSETVENDNIADGVEKILSGAAENNDLELSGQKEQCDDVVVACDVKEQGAVSVEDVAAEIDVVGRSAESTRNKTERYKQVIGETIMPKTQIIGETVVAQKTIATFGTGDELKKSIGVNDKFYLTRELFNGDSWAYNRGMARLDEFASLEDAVLFIYDNYAWNPDAEATKLLMSLLTNKFNK